VPTAVAARMNALCVLGVAVGSSTKGGSSPDGAWNQAGTSARHSRPERGRAASVRDERLQEPSWSRHADLLLEPDVFEVHWDDFANVDQAHAAGVKAMRRALPELRELLDQRSLLRRPEEPSGLSQSGVAL
jgi:predicted acylesterase/phospholipase RssA